MNFNNTISISCCTRISYSTSYTYSTRDLVEVVLDIDGIPVRFIDTAGIHITDDKVENLGIKKAVDRFLELKDEDKDKMTNKTYNHVKKNFSRDVVLKKYEELDVYIN